MEYLALQQKMLGSDPEQFRESPMEMERAEVHVPGDFTQGRAFSEIFAHKLHRGNEASGLGIRREIGGAQRNPVAVARKQAIKDDRSAAQRRIASIRHRTEDPKLPARIGDRDAI